VLEALKPLGKQYIANITVALNSENGWVDVFAHNDKLSGAYSSGTYGVHPYMLFNFDYEKGLTYEDVSTVAHEVGHSMHTYNSEKQQPFSNKDYATFNAEVASTVNEAIMAFAMLDKAREEYNQAKKKDPKELSEDTKVKKQKLIALLSQNIDNVRQTFYRQTMFATWEWEAHKMGEASTPLTKEAFCDLYGGLLKEYHGPVAEYEELSNYSWIYIPHFYYGYYVYTYATSYAASMALAKDIRAEYLGDKSKKGATERYLKYLGSGSSKHPVELLRDAGVDMATPGPILSLISQFSSWVDELYVLTK
jgi:oligoendopeptidase F